MPNQKKTHEIMSHKNNYFVLIKLLNLKIILKILHFTIVPRSK